MKPQEIEETKGTFDCPTFKSSYWGLFSALKIQNFIKTFRTIHCVILCRRPFCTLKDNDMIRLLPAEMAVNPKKSAKSALFMIRPFF